MSATEQEREEVKAERARFMAWMKTVEAARVKVVDESGLVQGMRLRYGYSPRGKRCFDSAPLKRGKRLNLVGWMGLDGQGGVAMQPSSINQPLFRGFVLKHLLPALKPGDIVVWDNHRINDAEGLQEQIEALGAELKPLPRYSPDLSPIEPCWSKLKHIVRKLRADTMEALETAVEEAVSLVSADDARGWFTHCGFCLQSE
jgi:hypothetical protein